MYYKNYEDYMRSILGYPVQNKDTYNMDYYTDRENSNNQCQNTRELETYYPEIYKILNPIVIETCNKYDVQITREILENMVDEVYRKIENNNEISIKINIDSRVNNKNLENRNLNIKQLNNYGVNRNINNNDINRNIYTESDRRPIKPSNPFLRDLIKIMILNRVLGGGILGRPPRPHISPYIK